jgi:DNA polymerase
MGRIAHPPHPGAPLLLFGQFPGKDEDITGLPMQGQGGRWVHWAVCQVAGINWDECFFSNVLGCKPPEGKVKKAYSEPCSPRIHELIALVQPKLLVAMGLEAAKFFSGNSKLTISKAAGKFDTFGKYEILYTRHPFEPARQKSVPARLEIEHAVQSDFTVLRRRCTELGIIAREIE